MNVRHEPVSWHMPLAGRARFGDHADPPAPGTLAHDSDREMTLLLTCVRAVLGTQSAENGSQQVRMPVDWERLVTTALGHGVMPHLHVGMAGPVATAVPEATREDLQRHFRTNARLNLFRTGELLELLALFDAHAIRAVPLKGPVLAMSLYGSLGMRQFTDLDLLIPAQNVGCAERLLRSRGYEVRSAGGTSLTAIRAGEPCPITLDVQWALAEERYSFPLTAELLRSRLTRAAFMHRMVWQPALDDQILILCGHPAKHCWSRLAWVSDVAAFVVSHGDALDWRRVLDRVGGLGGRRLVLLGLRLADDLLRLPLPGEVRASVRADRVAGDLASELSAKLCQNTSGLNRLNGSYGLVEAGILYIRTRERIADKVPYGLFLVRLFRQWCTPTPNEQDRTAIALPYYLGVLYFVVRPLRLLGKYGGRLLRCSLRAATSWR
jgi:hypothetical protein